MGKGFALLMEMGCGKSITTVAIAGRAYLNGFIERLLILAPKSIVEVWREEFSKFADFPYILTVLEGSSTDKKKQLLSISGEGLQVAVMNYDSVYIIEESIINWKPDFIVCDESSRIKNPAAKTSKSIHKIAANCPYRMILNGTPITKNPLDLFSQYKALDENIFGTSFMAFQNRYRLHDSNTKPPDYYALSELTKKAYSIAFRVKKEQALDLPETIDKIHPVILECDVRKLYKGIEKETLQKLKVGEATETSIFTTLLKLQQITGGFYKFEKESEEYRCVSRAKLKALEDIVHDYVSGGEKLVIMARFIPEIKAIAESLRKLGIKYALVYGDVKDRTKEINKFQQEQDCMVFLGQLQTASMGITLTAASTMVFYSLSYNYGDYIQSKARIHRIGQRKPCTYIHLIAKGTVDESVLASLRAKENIARVVVDDWKSILKQKH